MASFLGSVLGGIGNAAETAVKLSPYAAQTMAAQKALDLQRSQIALNQFLAQEENRRANEAVEVQRAQMGLTPVDSNAPPAPGTPPMASPAPSAVGGGPIPSETPGTDTNGMPTVPPPVSGAGPTTGTGPRIRGGVALPQQAVANPAPPTPPPTSTPAPGGMGGFAPPAAQTITIGGKQYAWNPANSPAFQLQLYQKEIENEMGANKDIRVANATGATAKNQAQAYAATPAGAAEVERAKAGANYEFQSKLQEAGIAANFKNAKELENIRVGVQQGLQRNQQLFDSNKISADQKFQADLAAWKAGADAADRSAEIYQGQRGPHLGFFGGAAPITNAPSNRMAPPVPPPAPAVPGVPTPAGAPPSFDPYGHLPNAAPVKSY